MREARSRRHAGTVRTSVAFICLPLIFCGLPAALAQTADAEQDRFSILGPGTEPPNDEEHQANMRTLEAAMVRTLDGLLAAAGAGDEARFEALLGTSPSGERPNLNDDRTGNPVVTPLRADTLRPFAAECRRSEGPSEFVFTVPPSHVVNYVCAGESGYQIFGVFGGDGTRISWLSLQGPNTTQPIVHSAEGQAQFDGDGVEVEALFAAMSGSLASLLAAARDGDQARFDALLGRGRGGAAAAFDVNGPIDHYDGPLILQAVRPLADRCRRSAEPLTFNNLDPLTGITIHVCNGQPGHFFLVEYEAGGRRITRLSVDGPAPGEGTPAN